MPATVLRGLHFTKATFLLESARYIPVGTFIIKQGRAGRLAHGRRRNDKKGSYRGKKTRKGAVRASEREDLKNLDFWVDDGNQ